MMASRPILDNLGKWSSFAMNLLQNTTLNSYMKHFPQKVIHFLHENFNTESVAGAIENKQDVVGYLTFTFTYKRPAQNPNYYNLKERVTGYFMITLSDQEASKCVLEILSSALEKAQLPIRPGEVKVLQRSVNQTGFHLKIQDALIYM